MAWVAVFPDTLSTYLSCILIMMEMHRHEESISAWQQHIGQTGGSKKPNFTDSYTDEKEKLHCRSARQILSLKAVTTPRFQYASLESNFLTALLR